MIDAKHHVLCDLNQIKKLLKQVSPRPWYIDNDWDHLEDHYILSDNDAIICACNDTNPFLDADKIFIASAPSTIAALVEEVERLQRELSIATKASACFFEVGFQGNEKLTAAHAEIERLKKELEER